MFLVLDLCTCSTNKQLNMIILNNNIDHYNRPLRDDYRSDIAWMYDNALYRSDVVRDIKKISCTISLRYRCDIARAIIRLAPISDKGQNYKNPISDKCRCAILLRYSSISSRYRTDIGPI